MKEKYIPSADEVKNAEEMMTREENKMSEERETTYLAGHEKGRHSILELKDGADFEAAKNLEDMVSKGKISPESRDLIVSGDYGQPGLINIRYIEPNGQVSEQQIINFIKTAYNEFINAQDTSSLEMSHIHTRFHGGCCGARRSYSKGFFSKLKELGINESNIECVYEDEK